MKAIIKIIQKKGMRIAIIKNENRIEVAEVDNKDIRIFGMDINIFKEDFIKNSKWEISWSSLGAKNTEDTKKYITLLTLATELAEKENNK